MVKRHGNYVTVDRNYFIGDGVNENYGGIRIINTGHWVTNNLFYKIKGKNFINISLLFLFMGLTISYNSYVQKNNSDKNS